MAFGFSRSIRTRAHYIEHIRFMSLSLVNALAQPPMPIDAMVTDINDMDRKHSPPNHEQQAEQQMDQRTKEGPWMKRKRNSAAIAELRLHDTLASQSDASSSTLSRPLHTVSQLERSHLPPPPTLSAAQKAWVTRRRNWAQLNPLAQSASFPSVVGAPTIPILSPRQIAARKAVETRKVNRLNRENKLQVIPASVAESESESESACKRQKTAERKGDEKEKVAQVDAPIETASPQGETSTLLQRLCRIRFPFPLF